VKGYTEVRKEVASLAVDNFRTMCKTGELVRDCAIYEYHNKHYKGGSKFHQWWYRKDTPKEYVLRKVGAWGEWSNVLYNVMDEKQLNLLERWENRMWRREEARQVEALVNASNSDRIYVGEELARFINSYKDWRYEE